MAVYAMSCRKCGRRIVQLTVARSVSLLFAGALGLCGLYALQSCVMAP